MPVLTYNPKDVELIVGGVPIGGFADGSFITVERSNDTFTKVSGADGILSRAKSNDFSGMITINLAQTSASNDVLQALAVVDETTGAGVVPVLLKDNSGRAKHFSAFSWIRKPANAEYAKEITDRQWILDCGDLVMGNAGNTATAPSEIAQGEA